MNGQVHLMADGKLPTCGVVPPPVGGVTYLTETINVTNELSAVTCPKCKPLTPEVAARVLG